MGFRRRNKLIKIKYKTHTNPNLHKKKNINNIYIIYLLQICSKHSNKRNQLEVVKVHTETNLNAHIICKLGEKKHESNQFLE
jgi:hypothetical protein